MKVPRELKQLDQKKKKEKSTYASHPNTHTFTLKFQRKEKEKKKKILAPLFNVDKLDVEANQKTLSAVIDSSIPKCLNPGLVMQYTHISDIKCRISGATQSILTEDAAASLSCIKINSTT